MEKKIRRAAAEKNNAKSPNLDTEEGKKKEKTTVGQLHSASRGGPANQVWRFFCCCGGVGLGFVGGCWGGWCFGFFCFGGMVLCWVGCIA